MHSSHFCCILQSGYHDDEYTPVWMQCLAAQVVYFCYVYLGWFCIASAMIIAHVSSSGLVIQLLLQRLRLHITRAIVAAALETGEIVRSACLIYILFQLYSHLPHK